MRELAAGTAAPQGLSQCVVKSGKNCWKKLARQTGSLAVKRIYRHYSTLMPVSAYFFWLFFSWHQKKGLTGLRLNIATAKFGPEPCPETRSWRSRQKDSQPMRLESKWKSCFAHSTENRKEPF